MHFKGLFSLFISANVYHIKVYVYRKKSCLLKFLFECCFEGVNVYMPLWINKFDTSSRIQRHYEINESKFIRMFGKEKYLKKDFHFRDTFSLPLFLSIPQHSIEGIFSCLIIHSRLNIDKSCLQQSKSYFQKEFPFTIKNQIFNFRSSTMNLTFLLTIFLVLKEKEKKRKILMTSTHIVSIQLMFSQNSFNIHAWYIFNHFFL